MRLIILFATAALAAADCECGYTVNASTAENFALFTQILETDFLHVQSLNTHWIPQVYNVTPENARGPYGKTAQLSNVVPNPLASEFDWGGAGDPGLQLWVRKELFEDTMIPMSEIVSSRADMLYGSFRIGMKTTPVNGTCGAFFFYRNDTAEIDLEYLSARPQVMNLVIQSPESAETGYVSPGTEDFDGLGLGFEAAEGFHEYRFDWVPGRVEFWVDGVAVRVMREGVPRAAGRVHVSHWSNGNKGWSGGPPMEDARLTVSYVKAYFNSSEVAGGGCVEGGKSCEIPNQLTPPDPGGANGNQTGRTFFFLGPENTTESGDVGGSGNSSSPTKGGAARVTVDIAPSSACCFILLVATIMVLGA